ncbi:mechanosensitive ion channel family protein [Paenibacillus sp.]|uniref:mechanosensitive ion channel family protein n=1 Tax=Paenibacillus sp. TaxID=58172 RepID=UPI002D2837A8|nr:mechanosensitive ion channel family protein [Paenibacillus sp.]HZG57288.1 mechanosensitive ion channel family protein [Paenibacillus sp.]
MGDFQPDVWVQSVYGFLMDPAVWLTIVWVLTKILIYFIVGRIVVGVAGRAITHMVIEQKAEQRGPVKFDPRRAQTIGRLVNNVVSYTVNFIVIMLILSEVGVDLAPLLAGAGVMGLAIGFGAQSLVKDVITGFFIIFEDQFAVGDVIKTGNFQGTVEEIGLRVTRIKSWTGEVHIIPNGAITQVTNFSTNISVGVVDVSIAYESDIEKATEVIKRTALEVYEANENMTKEPDVLGVQTLGASEVVIRVTFECKPMTHFGAGRQLNAAIKKALDAEGIEIPYPRLVTFTRSE